jgi:hypothetical protein
MSEAGQKHQVLQLYSYNILSYFFRKRDISNTCDSIALLIALENAYLHSQNAVDAVVRGMSDIMNSCQSVIDILNGKKLKRWWSVRRQIGVILDVLKRMEGVRERSEGRRREEVSLWAGNV